MSDGTVQLINYAVWAISIGILGWLLYDALRVETTYDRELLVSSVEGEIEKEILGHYEGHAGHEDYRDEEKGA
ncbi:MAG: hypothetical protein ACYC6T_05490 [Thermoleophilia bacterium]